MISVQQVSKQFSGRVVLKDIAFNIEEGEVVGLLGPNGAGKTTTLRLIAGVLPVTRGEIRVEGKNPLEEAEIRQSIGYLPENNPLYEEMTVEEWLRYWARIKQVTDDGQAIPQVVTKTGLEPVYYRLIGELSKGFRQRVGLAQAMLGDPKVLLLDEPSEGLDPNQRREIQQLIKDLGQKRTVVISSHVLGEITKMCNRILILNQGQIVADGTPEELSAASGGQIVEVEIKGQGVASGLKAIKSVSEVVKETGNRYQLRVDGNKDVRLAVFELAKKQKWDLYELSRKQIDLEEVFSKLTK